MVKQDEKDEQQQEGKCKLGDVCCLQRWWSSTSKKESIPTSENRKLSDIGTCRILAEACEVCLDKHTNTHNYN